MTTVNFDSERKALVFEDGSVAAVGRIGDWTAIEPAQVRLTSIAELGAAMAAAYESDRPAFVWALWPESASATARNREPTTAFLRWDQDHCELRGGAMLDIEQDEDPSLEAAVPALIAAVVQGARATAEVTVDPYKGRWVTVEMTIDDTARPGGDLLQATTDIAALLDATTQGQITLESARGLVAGGHARALVGMSEGAWLDAKSEPYALGDRLGKWELGKDVAAFASAIGGLILIPAKTTVDASGVETVSEIKTIDRGLVSEKSYRDVIADKVFPAPRGVQITFVDDSTGRGQLSIYVPPQREEDKPFLVRGAEFAGKVKAHSITVPWRDGDGTRYDEIASVHAALRAHRLGRPQEDAGFMERIRIDQFGYPHPSIIEAARRAGLKVEVFAGQYRVHLPDEHPIDIDARGPVTPLTSMWIDNVLRRLGNHGVPVTTTKRGATVLVDDPILGDHA